MRACAIDGTQREASDFVRRATATPDFAAPVAVNAEGDAHEPTSQAPTHRPASHNPVSQCRTPIACTACFLHLQAPAIPAIRSGAAHGVDHPLPPLRAGHRGI